MKTHRGALELTDTGTYSGIFLKNTNTTDPTTNGQICYVSGVGIRAYAEGAAVTIGAAGAGGATSWDALYDADKTLDVDDTTFTLNGTALLGAGAVLTIANAGTGKDIVGPAWSIISTGAKGILELTSGGTINATDGALTIGKAATATTLAGTLVVAGTAATTSITLTAGNIVTSAGGLSLTKAANNATFSLTNNTATSASVIVLAGSGAFTGNTTSSFMTLTPSGLTTGTGLYMPLAAMTTGTGVSVVAGATTAGTILLLTGNTTFTGTGYYFRCYDGAANDFTIGVGGATAIAGTGATNVFTVTAGDLVVSDGSLTMTDADNAATVSITNNTATTASVFVLVGSGVFTGSTTTSFATITASGLTTGTAVYIPCAALTTGKALHIGASAMTSGTALYINAVEATLTTGKYIQCYDGAADDFSVAKYGAVTIAGNAATTVLTITAGDLVMSDGAFGSANEAVTCGGAATTFAVDSNLVTVTGDAGANTIATITGGVAGQLVTLIFVDALVTVTDTDAHTANTVDLSAAFTSADDTVLQLVFDGTSWYEVSRSVN